MTFLRWFLLVRAQDLPFTFASAVRLGMVGYFFNTFLPGSVGGDLVKAACIIREQSRRTVAVATVVVDRAVGLCGLIWLAALCGGFFWANGMLEEMASPASGAAVAAAVPFLETIVLGTIVLMAGSVIFWVLAGLLPERLSLRLAHGLERIPKIGHALAEFWRAGWLYRRREGVVVVTLAMSMVSHSGFVLAFYCAARTLFPAEEVPSLAAHFLVIPVGMTIQGFFPSPGGIGGGEFGFGQLYELIGFSFSAGVLASLVRRAVDWTWGLAGYLVYLRMRPTWQRAEQEAAREIASPPEAAVSVQEPFPSR
jgi:glycosyltransferase 2 family protein